MDYQPIQLSPAQIQQFQTDGFLILENFLPLDYAQQLASRLEPMFHGEFETGIYPDEWHWRPRMSLSDITREICNGWKSDRLRSFWKTSITASSSSVGMKPPPVTRTPAALCWGNCCRCSCCRCCCCCCWLICL